MNFMPFGQLKSFLKILIEVQYDLPLPVIAQEKDRHGAGAGVGADDCAGVVDQHFLDAVLGFQNVLHVLGILDAVAVAEEHRAVVVISAQLAQLVGDGLSGIDINALKFFLVKAFF